MRDMSNCGEVESSCVCQLPEGHETKWHACECGGEWARKGEDFESKTPPGTAPGWMFEDIKEELCALMVAIKKESRD